MEHHVFGQTGLVIPPIVFGTSSLGNLYKVLPQETKHEIVRQWFAQVTAPVAIDSAGKYGAGLALETIGHELASLGVNPSQVTICNKLGWRRKPLTTPEPTFEPGVWTGLEHDAVQDISYDGILRCWEEGCELLGNYPPDLVSVHDPDEYLAAAASTADREARWQDILRAYQALDKLKQRGLVKGIGVGAKDWRVIREISVAFPLDWVMFANSFTLYRHPPELLEFIRSLAEKGTGIINSAVFHSGFLVGGSHFDYHQVDDDSSLLDWRKKFHTICASHSVSPVDACVEFAASPPGFNALALNTSDPARVAANVSSITSKAPSEFWGALKDGDLIGRDYPYR